jgi:hypothetical protein
VTDYCACFKFSTAAFSKLPERIGGENKWINNHKNPMSLNTTSPIVYYSRLLQVDW